MSSENMSRGRIRAEIAIVLSLSLGASAIYSIVNIAERLTRETALSEQTATINRSLSARPEFDFIYQFLQFAFGLAPVALVVFLIWNSRKPHLEGLGIRPCNAASSRYGCFFGQAAWGIAIAAAIGIPGIFFYLGSKGLGLNTTVVPNALEGYWWTVPMLVLQALRAALTEELIVVGYLFNRLEKLGWGPLWIICFSAVLRGTYHLYQGFGGFVGNILMGLLFAWIFYRYRRVVPLIFAHLILDIVSFVGYPLAVSMFPDLF